MNWGGVLIGGEIGVFCLLLESSSAQLQPACGGPETSIMLGCPSCLGGLRMGRVNIKGCVPGGRGKGCVTGGGGRGKGCVPAGRGKEGGCPDIPRW